MKHLAEGAEPDPIQIGRTVRGSIETFLCGHLNLVDSNFPHRIERFAIELARWGSKTNLTAHPEDPEEITFHILDSLMPIVLANNDASVLTGQFDSGRQILDLGSGAGFPSLVLAAASLASFTLVESRRKRASFLQVAASEMGLRNVTMVGRRIEEIAPSRDYDLVTARAFGDPIRFFRLAGEALKPGGLAMLYANPTQHFGANITIIHYDLARRGAKVERILALYRQPVDSPHAAN